MKIVCGNLSTQSLTKFDYAGNRNKLCGLWIFCMLKNSLSIKQQSSSGPAGNGFIQSDKQFVFHPYAVLTESLYQSK